MLHSFAENDSAAESLAALEERKRLDAFTGRDSELATFRRALDGNNPRVLYVWGPAGIGKTSLLAAFAAEAQRHQRETSRIDARFLDRSLPAVLSALAEAGIGEEASDRAAPVVLLDTYEHLKSIEPLLLRELLRHLKREALLVVASRTPPSADWRALALWGSVVAPMALRNLDAHTAEAYLTRRGLAPDVAAAVRAFSHGHPLALALAADAWQHAPDRPFAPHEAPDLVTGLYEYFVRDVAEPSKRAALEAAAVLRTTTETALAAMLDEPGTAAETFAWLRELSIMQFVPRGVAPHDLARGVILAELRWRNPARLAGLVTRAQRHIVARLSTTNGTEAVDLVDEFAYALGHNPRLGRMLRLPDEDLTLDGLRPGDEHVIAAATLRHEGPYNESCVRYWLRRHPSAFTVARTPDGTVAAFTLFLRIDHTTEADRAIDRAVRAAWDYATWRLGRTPRECVTYGRFVLACDTGQALSPALAACMRVAARVLFFSRDVALSFMRQHAGRLWEKLELAVGAEFVAELEHEDDHKRFEVSVLDHRGKSRIEWFGMVNERTAVAEWRGPPPKGDGLQEPLLAALNRDEFALHLRDALRAINDISELAKNPLIHSQVVRGRAPAGVPDEELAQVLQRLLREGVASLRGSTQREPLRAVLDRAYVNPASKQAAAATELGLSHSTFRRHLAEATQQLVDTMWSRELALEPPRAQSHERIRQR